MTVFDLSQTQTELHGKNPRTILKTALTHFDNIAISFSGAEDVVLIDMAMHIRKDIQVFSLDTGRLHAETYRFIDQVRKHYGITIDILSPDHQPLEALVKAKGLFSFYDDGHQECCGIRKVAPLRRKLATLDAWITGQRKDQSQDTRGDIPEVQRDAGFSTADKPLIKFNPLLNWTSAQVWDYIEAYQVPFNDLHRHGYISIGCEPCTRPVLPNQPERAGRWWWEDATKKECGLHIGNKAAR
ncbi:MAG: phosphoadenylyl-sulfate reductase [Methylomonas sp.]|nr:phosphoadenylyl-sulfate reductase [Methylomonas sp.]PPD20342.1 MAG: phosphoadenylyl-sulfate reductase [Methylomonas sp.]PPD26613.1 MAG: phosphoadenylyl-sulfate reductase [Methylomonas sp.]PPD38401.1 MAG: phosphoadenylyl-sulfate reductase [Methylomonas sp.]PPD40443.1 MAG: phosphoadenylyl-sulfate reductase [Methylomonas sp.]